MATKNRKRKRKSKPTGKRRSEEQRVKDRLAHALDDARRLDIIPMRPEEVLGPERADPARQSEQPLPALIGQAVRSGWATPEDVKIRSVDEMARLVGASDEEVPPHIKVMATRVLQQGDQIQFERDNPELAARAKGTSTVNVGVQVNNKIDPLALFQQAMVEVEHDEIEERIAEELEPANSEVPK